MVPRVPRTLPSRCRHLIHVHPRGGGEETRNNGQDFNLARNKHRRRTKCYLLLRLQCSFCSAFAGEWVSDGRTLTQHIYLAAFPVSADGNVGISSVNKENGRRRKREREVIQAIDRKKGTTWRFLPCLKVNNKFGKWGTGLILNRCPCQYLIVCHNLLFHSKIHNIFQPSQEGQEIILLF